MHCARTERRIYVICSASEPSKCIPVATVAGTADNLIGSVPFGTTRYPQLRMIEPGAMVYHTGLCRVLGTSHGQKSPWYLPVSCNTDGTT